MKFWNKKDLKKLIGTLSRLPIKPSIFLTRFGTYLCALFLMSSSVAWSQKTTLTIVFNDSAISANEIADYNHTPNKNNVNLELTDFLQQLYAKAYLSASLDSLSCDTNYCYACFHLGKNYRWNQLKNGNIDEGILSKTGFRDKLYQNKSFNKKQLYSLFNKVIGAYENNGYPFASIQLDSITINNEHLSAQLYVKKNQFYRIDSVIVKGDVSVSKKYLQHFIKIKEGDVYNESLIAGLSNRLKALPFVNETGESTVVFSETQAKLYLPLTNNNSNKFNGILGFLSDDNTEKIQLTGDIRLSLANTLKQGEELDFNWRSLPQNTQDLQLLFNYPFVFQMPFGTNYQLKLYKRDTTYLDVYHKLGLRYLLKGNNYFQVFYNIKTSNLLSTNNLNNLSTLPNFLDVTSQLYGVGFLFEKLDYQPNPRKGYNIETNGAVGNKTIHKNPNINDVLYNNIALKSLIYELHLNTALYLPIKRRSVLKFGLQNSYLQNDNLLTNELFRIGGLKTLRGFDEETIFTNTYTIGTIEYRFIFEQNSYFYAFFDQAYYEDNVSTSQITDTPYGFGTGLSFGTKAGIFSINYALGSQFDNPILFRNAKVHFGFVSLF